MSTKIIRGDCRDVLSSLPADSVHCIVTSPPFHGLRDYGVDGQIGMEATLAEYIDTLVDVGRHLRRVLRPDGVMWWEHGDSYAGSWGAQGRGGTPSSSSTLKGLSTTQIAAAPKLGSNTGTIRDLGLKPKDLTGQPWRVAFALQNDGWWLRSANIWHRPNPMPESVTDRSTIAHSYVFMFAKSGASTFWTHRDLSGSRVQPEPDYRWVHKETGEESAIPQDASEWRRVNLWRGHDYFFDQEAVKEHGTGSDPGNVAQHKNDDGTTLNRTKAGLHAVTATTSRNLRSVWTIATEPFNGSHFAVFPSALAERCIKAGTSERGCCPACGAPWVRSVNVTYDNPGNRTTNGPRSIANHDISAGFAVRLEKRTETTGFRPSCDCPPANPVPATVLDPFSGAGTTGLVADRLGRDAILIELNEDYADMAARRLRGDGGMFASVDLVHADEPIVPAITE